MVGDGRSYRIEFRGREAPRREEFAGAGNRVGDMIPARELSRVRGAMTHEDAQIMHPGGGKENVIVEFQSLPDAVGESIKPRLVAEFVHGARFRPDVFDDRLAPIRTRHAGSPFPEST